MYCPGCGIEITPVILATAVIGGLASYRRYLRKTLTGGQLDQTAVPAPQPGLLLSEPLMQPMISVTEATTGLLGVPRHVIAKSTGEGFLKT